MLNSFVKQRFPLSPCLFALNLEPPCRRVICSPLVTGHYLLSVEGKVLTYADDAAFFLDDKTSVYVSLVLVDGFCQAAVIL